MRGSCGLQDAWDGQADQAIGSSELSRSDGGPQEREVLKLEQNKLFAKPILACWPAASWTRPVSGAKTFISLIFACCITAPAAVNAATCAEQLPIQQQQRDRLALHTRGT